LESVNYVAIAVSVAAGLAGFATAALFYWPAYARFSAAAFNKRFALVYDWSHHKGYFDEIYEALFARGIIVNIGRAAQWLDTNVIDGFVNGVADGYLYFGDRLRKLQTGKVQGYAVGLFTALVAIAVAALIFGSSGPLASAAGLTH
jgi:NADH-quinone oxidoreductase subunit L